jgi:hypothetical protein
MPSPSHPAIAPVVSPRRLWIKPAHQKPYVLTVDSNDTMYMIKARIENRDGHCRDQQRVRPTADPGRDIVRFDESLVVVCS